MHGIGTQAPREVWITLDRKARKPLVTELPVKVVRFSAGMASLRGRDARGARGASASDSRGAHGSGLLRYRIKIGLDVALEALRGAIQSRRTSIAEIARVAEVCRIQTVVSPYLEAFIA